MKAKRIKIVTAVAVLAALGGTGAGFASSRGDDGDNQATGPGADRARAAALSHLGGGTANAVERDSENGAVWEVEVTKQDGKTVDVRLDGSYRVVGVEGDSEQAGADDARDGA